MWAVRNAGGRVEESQSSVFECCTATAASHANQLAAVPLLAEEDLLEDAHLSVPLGQLLGAVGPGADQAAGQGQGSGRRPRDPLLHGVVGQTPRHLERLPVHHQLPLGRFSKVLDLVDVDWRVWEEEEQAVSGVSGVSGGPAAETRVSIQGCVSSHRAAALETVPIFPSSCPHEVTFDLNYSFTLLTHCLKLSRRNVKHYFIN